MRRFGLEKEGILRIVWSAVRGNTAQESYSHHLQLFNAFGVEFMEFLFRASIGLKARPEYLKMACIHLGYSHIEFYT